MKKILKKTTIFSIIFGLNLNIFGISYANSENTIQNNLNPDLKQLEQAQIDNTNNINTVKNEKLEPTSKNSSKDNPKEDSKTESISSDLKQLCNNRYVKPIINFFNWPAIAKMLIYAGTISAVALLANKILLPKCKEPSFKALGHINNIAEQLGIKNAENIDIKVLPGQCKAKAVYGNLLINDYANSNPLNNLNTFLLARELGHIKHDHTLKTVIIKLCLIPIFSNIFSYFKTKIKDGIKKLDYIPEVKKVLTFLEEHPKIAKTIDLNISIISWLIEDFITSAIIAQTFGKFSEKQADLCAASISKEVTEAGMGLLFYLYCQNKNNEKKNKTTFESIKTVLSKLLDTKPEPIERGNYISKHFKKHNDILIYKKLSTLEKMYKQRLFGYSI